MKKYFEQLRPFERRLAVAVLVVLFLVLNYVFIWPHLSDWGMYQARMDAAKRKLDLYHRTIAQAPKYETLVTKMEGEGGKVAPEDQAINFLRAIQTQSVRSGVGIVGTSPQRISTNEFFVQLTENLNVIGNDQQLVNFLYQLGSDTAMIRVRALEMQPDPAHQHLNARIELIASYQKTAGAGNLTRKLK